MELETKRNPRGSRRRLIYLWAITATVAVMLVATKAAVADWYRHRRDVLAARGELPSQIASHVDADLRGNGGGTIEQVRAAVGVPTEPSSNADRFAEGPLGLTVFQSLRFGNFARDGWTVFVPFGSDHRMYGWLIRYDNDRWIGRAGACAATVSRIIQFITPLSGFVCFGLSIVTVAMWSKRQRVGQYAMAAGLLCCTAASLSTAYDRTFLDPSGEAAHWVAIVLMIAAAGITYWPRRPAIPGRCGACSYDLTGNVSGVCPECGTAVVMPQ